MNRIKWIDVSKGIAIILVIAGHTLPRNSLPWDLVYSFHMPFFFFISGYLFKPRGNIETLKNSTQRLLLPYFFTGLLIVILSVLRSIFIDADIGTTLGNNILAVLFGSGVQPIKGFPDIQRIGAIWFLLSLFIVMIIFNLIVKKMEKLNLPLQFGLMAVIGGLGYAISTFVYLPWNIDIALMALPFFYVGYKSKQLGILEKKPNLIYLTLAAIVWIASIFMGVADLANRIYPNVIMNYFGAFAGSYLIIHFSKYIAEFRILQLTLGYLGINSLAILCFHLIEETFFPFYWLGPIHIVILFIFKVVSITLACLLLERLPIFRSVYFGKKK